MGVLLQTGMCKNYSSARAMLVVWRGGMALAAALLCGIFSAIFLVSSMATAAS